MTLEAHPEHSLAAHLLAVGNTAAEFARHFRGEDHARLAGLLHDLGKAEPEFQKRVATNNKDGKKQPHAYHGAALALSKDIWPVAFAVNGHHAGLHDRHALHSMAGKRDYYVSRAEWSQKELEKEPFPILAEQLERTKGLPKWLDSLPLSTPEERETKLRTVELYTRFLFSALIDADRLDAEEHGKETKENYGKRHNWRFGAEGLAIDKSTQELLPLLDAAIAERRKAAEDKGASKEVLDVRAQVLEACKQAARQTRGVFTLTVPTGGGKTLASVYFALKHIEAQNRQTADAHKKLRRIIVVIPYLNIIQQTVLELKKTFADLRWDEEAKEWIPSENLPVVLEHHSQAQDPPLDEKREDDYSRERTLRQLAAENWDAPIVVTTSVQFFDSLFSRRPADARKLHNIAQSVIIFDEVQTFPPRLMQPILDVLGELASPQRSYGCSLVFCTATQPALRYDEADLRWGLKDVREIVGKPVEHFQVLQRTTYQWPIQDAQGKEKTLSWDDLAGEVLHEALGKQALVVVNTRRHARELFEAVREKIVGGKESVERPEHLFHLSTWMTPAHRVAVLDEVKERLEAKRPCLLISTQCIEAGVDVDFPAVWRAFGPYDAIVQAAGRCNRNGALKDAAGQPIKGVVRVFRPEDHDKSIPQGVYQTATSQTGLLRRMKAADPHNPESFLQYFRLLYQLSVPDECEIQKHREQLHFKQVHERFDFIEACTIPVLVVDEVVDGQPRPTPAKSIYETARKKFIPGSKERGYFTREDWRAIQPFIVNLDYRNKQVQQALARYAPTRVFDSDDLDLRIWGGGSAGYIGGINGFGIALSPDFSALLNESL